MNYILCYGTLRFNEDGKPDYNYNRFGGQKFIKEFALEGFQMFSLGSFPCVVPTYNKEDKITVELHSVENSAFERINGMEEGAGYRRLEVLINGITATIYYYPSNPKGAKFIENGDWTSFKRK